VHNNTKLLIAALATVFAASSIQAATYSKPSAKPGIEAASVELTAGKKKSRKKTAKKARKSKAAKVAAFKSCGTFMYRKDGKCVDARTKK
jgi:hypothetical protein